MMIELSKTARIIAIQCTRKGMLWRLWTRIPHVCSCLPLRSNLRLGCEWWWKCRRCRLGGGTAWLRWPRKRQQRWCWAWNCWMMGEVLVRCSVNIGDFVLLLTGGPINSLLHLKLIVVPHLHLILGSVATYQYLSVLVIQRIASHMRPEDWLHALPLPNVPKMQNAIPTSRKNGVLIDEFNRKDAIWMPSIVPLRTS